MQFGRYLRLLPLLALFLLLTPAVNAQYNVSTHYRESPCPFDTSTLFIEVTCGLLTVPENRPDRNTNMITLAVMTAHSPNPPPPPDPIVFLAGGPGESAISNMVPILSSDAGLWLVAERDWVIMDQRGTGYSVPRLDCNIFGIARIASEDALGEASDVCYQRYAGAGIDLSAYTTDENAADFADLRAALGYDEWNLFGVSYGTTLALTMMQQQPEGIRSVVLDSVLPPPRSFFVSDVESKIGALQRLFDTCAADEACRSAYPDLAPRFEAAVEMLNEAPLQVGDLPLTGDFLVFALTNTSVFQRDVISALPSLIDSALSGDVQGLAQLLGGVAEGSDSGDSYESDLVAANDGMGLAMNCSRDARFPDVEAQLVSIEEASPSANALAGLYLRYLAACRVWADLDTPITPPAPTESDIPTLMLVGEWDPSTPPALAEEAAETLPNATVIIFPGQGHSVLLDAESSCPSQLLNAFIDAPDATLDSPCVEDDYTPITFAR
jgi:pimeloyl-ACP methyl ester carboxylesterase